MRQDKRFFRKITPLIIFLIISSSIFIFTTKLQAEPISELSIPQISINVGKADQSHERSFALQILFLLTILSLAPAFIIMVTSFTRIIVILSLLRNALAINQLPPNQVLIGLALFLTFFIMTPTWVQIKDKALEPYIKGEINQQQAWEEGIKPIREFTLRQTRKKDLALFVNLSKIEEPKGTEEIPTYVIIPAFIISELKTAFQIGFIVYLPFLIIDIVIASVIMSMGMFMLPPVMISLPFKLLLFVLVDGWDLVINSVITSFR
ncbi:flagellar type III secretion system pore protein FliP [Candidatus Aerophobetes bacterium]|nr:flagellar type III secretion system pore protein FliP [Candidatus Aerophobetes bacterium]